MFLNVSIPLVFSCKNLRRSEQISPAQLSNFSRSVEYELVGGINAVKYGNGGIVSIFAVRFKSFFILDMAPEIFCR